MAVIVGIVDADPERRARFVRDAQARLAGREELTPRRWDHGHLSLLAATAPSTPVHHSGEEGAWTWVVGDVYADEGGDPSRFLVGRVAESGPLETHGQGGYYLACTMEPSGRVTLGTDILGLFPLYYWSAAHVLVFSTLPGLIHLHPGHHEGLSAEGLAGILIQSYIANGQTLWEGICRPEPGRAVQWRTGAPAQTPLANPLVPSEEHFGLEYDRARELFGATLRDAVARSTRRAPDGLMLSGGMDSRLLAGLLHTLRPGGTRAVVFGNRGDNEVRCARGVARALDMPVVRLSTRFERYPAVARALLEGEQLSNTFHDLAWLTVPETLERRCREMVNGFLGDPIMGGTFVSSAYDPIRGVHDFDALLAATSVWGFSRKETVSLVGALPMAAAVDACLEKMRTAWEALPGRPFQKATLWGLYHRGRFHVGPYAWRLSRSVWPVMPYVDRPMLETGLGMSLEHLADRRIQIDTLKRDHRALAALPVDHNLPETPPLIDSWHQWAGRLVRRGLARVSPLRRERRTYYRLFDINNAGWRSLRRLAADRQESAHRLFRPEALRRYIPAPDDDIICADGINSSARLKTLLGLMILSDRLVD